MTRKVIEIDEAKCNGCGQCVAACHEGVIALVNGKAKVVREFLCDGLGSCIPQCPQGAIRLVERPAGECPHIFVETQSFWPIQLALVTPFAPFPKDLVIAADCTAFVTPNFHELLGERRVLIACPKLDPPRGYGEKLAEIFRRNDINSLEILHMEVPCCFGLVRLVEESIGISGKVLPLTITTLSIQGRVIRKVSKVAGQEDPKESLPVSQAQV
ncbi:4Fe-4S binding protein [Candidatus Caldatribacterium saccharofermentans]|uniref:4Fe-4S ferredoxin-type domain-containing protein n=1 Tax=Candidatus Caldatribacterium saccharofermentans TaxID=1454753 RepID=A0A7V4WJL4_9BACT